MRKKIRILWLVSIRKFWLWLFGLSASHVSLEEKLKVLDREWWYLVRFRLRELRGSDLGENFIKTLLVDEDITPDRPGREYRDTPQEREIRDYHISG